MSKQTNSPQIIDLAAAVGINDGMPAGAPKPKRTANHWTKGRVLDKIEHALATQGERQSAASRAVITADHKLFRGWLARLTREEADDLVEHLRLPKGLAEDAVLMAEEDDNA